MNKEEIIIANWKMNLNLAQTISLTKEYKKEFVGFDQGKIVVCPSALFLTEVAEILKSSAIKLGAQNVSWENRGAYTGEISANMLAEVGCGYVILGHSERRCYLFENYEMIHKKIRAVLEVENLTPIVCIGESLEDKRSDRRDFVLVDQLQQALSGIDIFGEQVIIIAYEPIWAIGTGMAIEPAEAEYAHKIIRLALNDMFGMQVNNKNFRVIYGGSISLKNIKGFNNLENMDGLLVGGASLGADEFYQIAKTLFK